jgi:hypothetical protein
MLATVDPSSDLGRILHDAIARLRFSAQSPEVREMAQKMLDGKADAHDLVALREFQPALDAGQRKLGEELAAMSEEDRDELLRPGSAAGSRA